jgi:nucleotide-binding universal stress UspA family protein
MPVAEVKPRLTLKNILFPTDFSEASRAALPFALALARRYHSHVIFVNVLEAIPVSPVTMDTIPSDIAPYRTIAETKLEEFLRFNSLDGVEKEVLVEPGYIWPMIKKLETERDVDLIVLGTHGRNALQRIFMGSVAEQIFRHASCPVMTIGPQAKPTLGRYDNAERILFATDFSPSSLHALDFALSLAADRDGRLVLLHVVQPPGVPLDVTEQLVNESEAKLRGLIKANATPAKQPVFATVVGAPADMILSVAARENVDVIVMGAHKPGAFSSHWPFEVAGHVVAHATCPVISVRA